MVVVVNRFLKSCNFVMPKIELVRFLMVLKRLKGHDTCSIIYELELFLAQCLAFQLLLYFYNYRILLTVFREDYLESLCLSLFL